MEHKIRARNLGFCTLEYAFRNETGDILFPQGLDNIEYIGKKTLEFGWIIEDEQNGGIRYGGLNID